MRRLIVVFVLALVVLNVLGYFIHHLVLQQLQLEEVMLLASYTYNFLLAGGMGLLIYLLRKKFATSLGFIFLLGSFFKFGVYFAAVHPVFNLDGEVSKLEFSMFFIPYGLNLIAETVFLARVLNKLDLSDSTKV